MHPQQVGWGPGVGRWALICVILPQDWAEGGSGFVLPNDKR